jgi:hypothetical protein
LPETDELARRYCCVELIACGRDQACSMGNAEFWCITNCVNDAVADGGVAGDETFMQCAGACAVGPIISSATNDLFTCLITGERTDEGIGTDCMVECFSGS